MRFNTLFNAVKSIKKISHNKNYGLIHSYLRFFRLVVLEQYSPVEIFMEDLLNPNWSTKQRAEMVSKERFLRLQEEINPASYRYLTEDKMAFNDYCMQSDLPVPELVAVLDPMGKSFWGSKLPIYSEKDCLDGLSDYPFDIIAKPVHGCHGEGVISLNFENGKHIPVNGSVATLSQYLAMIFAQSNDSYLLQRKLYSHKELVEFTDNTVLQSLRLITILDKNDQPKLIIRKIKFPKKGSVIDNFSWGIQEGRLCEVNENGYIKNTLIYCDQNEHLIRLDFVCNAKDEITDFKVPFWSQCVELALKAQKAFSPLRTIGWDIAVTDAGPILIEGNVFWDPLTPQEGNMLEICRILQSIE